MPSSPSRRRRPLGVIGLTALLVVSLPVSADAAGKGSDPQARRRELQEKRAEQAAEVNVLKASDAELEQALDRLDANVRAQEAQAASARQAAVAASEAAASARQVQERTAARLGDLRGSMRQVAVAAYVRGPSQETMLPLDAASLSEIATRQYLVDVALGKSTDLADELRATGEDLETQTAATEEAAQRATARRKEVDGRLSEVKQALDLKQEVAESVEQRLERALAEADSLAVLDRQLATEIAQRQAALAARIASTPRRARASRSASGPAGAVGTTSVRGITVATEIAEQLENLLSAAEADGFIMGGGGYRDSGGQIAVRRANCGTSNYDVYERPASSCAPPTARPGQSMHERGLAVDFTWNGALISSRNAAFQWLSRNAGRYGLSNLPREPWHWSTNGN